MRRRGEKFSHSRTNVGRTGHQRTYESLSLANGAVLDVLPDLHNLLTDSYVWRVRSHRSLAPKKRPGSKPKLDETARRLLEANLQERPAATLPQRREFLRRVAGVRVSDSTVSRMLKRMGRTRKKDGWVQQNATSS